MNNETSMTRFEKARVIGARALQISMGARPLVKTSSSDPIAIAREELEQGVIPIEVQRKVLGD